MPKTSTKKPRKGNANARNPPQPPRAPRPPKRSAPSQWSKFGHNAGRPLEYRQHKDGHMFRGTVLIGRVQSPPTGSITTKQFPLNPSQPFMGPLATIAEAFSTFLFTKATVRYKPTVGTSLNGGVAVVVSNDNKQPLPTDTPMWGEIPGGAYGTVGRPIHSRPLPVDPGMKYYVDDTEHQTAALVDQGLIAYQCEQIFAFDATVFSGTAVGVIELDFEVLLRTLTSPPPKLIAGVLTNDRIQPDSTAANEKVQFTRATAAGAVQTRNHPTSNHNDTDDSRSFTDILVDSGKAVVSTASNVLSNIVSSKLFQWFGETAAEVAESKFDRRTTPAALSITMAWSNVRGEWDISHGDAVYRGDMPLPDAVRAQLHPDAFDSDLADEPYLRASDIRPPTHFPSDHPGPLVPLSTQFEHILKCQNLLTGAITTPYVQTLTIPTTVNLKFAHTYVAEPTTDCSFWWETQTSATDGGFVELAGSRSTFQNLPYYPASVSFAPTGVVSPQY